jgi:endonuclease/exonuclease/phosphatase family metal-dependent hydrolase
VETVLCIWWNLQRLFRPGGSPIARDLDATAATGWTQATYSLKIKHIAAVLRAIAGDEAPALVGLCEVENRAVAEDIVEELGWEDLAYVEDPEERMDGADVVLLYSTDRFSIASPPRAHNVSNQYATRDILEVVLEAESGEELLVLLNHWPSRTYPNSEPLRISLADYCRRIFLERVRYPKNELFTATGGAKLPSRTALSERWNRPVVVMGDFNDSPFDVSVKRVLASTPERAAVTAAPRLPTTGGVSAVASYLRLRPRLFNPGWRVLGSYGGVAGSCVYNGDWYLLDQVLFSSGILGERGVSYVEDSFGLFAEPRVPLDGDETLEVLSRSGEPRAFNARSKSGVSDHLPIYFQLALDE